MAEPLHETLIKSLLVGGKSYQSSRAKAEEPVKKLKQQFLMKQLGNLISPEKYTPKTREEAIEFERAKSGIKQEAAEKKALLKPNFKTFSRQAASGQRSWESVGEAFPDKDVDKEKFNIDVQRVKRGKGTWDDLRVSYPQRMREIDTMHAKATPIRGSREFEEGSGLPALLSSKKAKLSPLIKDFVSAVDNEDDYKNALTYMKKEAAKRDGEFTQNDINTFLEYYGRK